MSSHCLTDLRIDFDLTLRVSSFLLYLTFWVCFLLEVYLGTIPSCSTEFLIARQQGCRSQSLCFPLSYSRVIGCREGLVWMPGRYSITCCIASGRAGCALFIVWLISEHLMSKSCTHNVHHALMHTYAPWTRMCALLCWLLVIPLACVDHRINAPPTRKPENKKPKPPPCILLVAAIVFAFHTASLTSIDA